MKRLVLVAAVMAAAVTATAANYIRTGYGESSSYYGIFSKNEYWAVGSRSGTQCPSGALHADEDYVCSSWNYIIADSTTFGGKSLTLNDGHVKATWSSVKELEFPRDGLIFAKHGGVYNANDLTLKGNINFLAATGGFSVDYSPGFWGAANTTLTVTGDITGESGAAMGVGRVYSESRWSGDNWTVRFEGDLSGYPGYMRVYANTGKDSTAVIGALSATSWRVKMLVAENTLNTSHLRVETKCCVGVANDGETLTLKNELDFRDNSGIAVDYAGTVKLDGTLTNWPKPITIMTGSRLNDGKSHSFAALVAPAGRTFTDDEFAISNAPFASDATVKYTIKTVDERSTLWCDITVPEQNIVRDAYNDDNDGSKGTFYKNENWQNADSGETCSAGDLDPEDKYLFNKWGFLGVTNYTGTGKVVFGGRSLTVHYGSVVAVGNENLEVEFPRDGLIGVCGTFINSVTKAELTVSGTSLTVGSSHSNYPFGFIGYVENATTRLTAPMVQTSASTGLSVGLGWADRKTSKNFTMIFDCDMSAYDKPIYVRYGQNESVAYTPNWGVKALFGTSPVASTVRMEKCCYVGAAKSGTTAVITGSLVLLAGSGIAAQCDGLLRVDGKLTLPAAATKIPVLVGTNLCDGAAHSFAVFSAPTGVTLDESQFEVDPFLPKGCGCASVSVKEVEGRSTLWCDVTPVQDNHVRDGCGESSLNYGTFVKNENWAVGSHAGTQCPAGDLNPEQGYYCDNWNVLRTFNYASAGKTTFGGLFLKIEHGRLDVYGTNYELEFPRMGLVGKCGTLYHAAVGSTLKLTGAFRAELTDKTSGSYMYPFGFSGMAGSTIRVMGPMTASTDSTGISVGIGWSGTTCQTNFTTTFEGDLSKFDRCINVRYDNSSMPVLGSAWGAKALFGETTMPGTIQVQTNCYIGAAVDGKTATVTGAVTFKAGAGLAIDSTGTLKLNGKLTWAKPVRVNVGPKISRHKGNDWYAFIAPAGVTFTLDDLSIDSTRCRSMLFDVVEVGGRCALRCRKQGTAIYIR